MKNLLKKIVLFILQKEAIICLKNNKPKIIAVYGEVCRSAFKVEIVNKLQAQGLAVRGSFKGYNSDIGIPLSILGLEAGFSSFWKWFNLVTQGYKKSFKVGNYPEFLVLEIAADNQGEIERISKILKPECLVISDFADDEQTILDKLIQVVTGQGIILLNGDTASLRKYQIAGDKKIIIFGLGNDASLKATNIKESDQVQEFVMNFGVKREVVSVSKFGIQSIYAELVSKFLAEYFSHN
jgi:hypothetical protein